MQSLKFNYTINLWFFLPQSDVPDDSLKYYYGPFSTHDNAMGGFALVNAGESTLTVSFIDYKGN